jgi:hypothetical protein
VADELKHQLDEGARVLLIDVFQLQMGFFTNSPLGTFYCRDLRKISKKHLTNAGEKRFVGLNLETT